MPFGQILIVEDSKTQAMALNMLLESRGMVSAIASNGMECLTLSETGRFSLILLDMVLPDTSGLQLIRRLKQSAITKQLPVIMLSGVTDKENVVDALLLGASDYISKPYHPEEVIVRVKMHLDILASKLDIEKLNEELRQQTRQLDWIVQQKSRELQTYLDAINMNICSMLLDRDGTILKVNEPFLKISGYVKEDLVGKKFVELNSEYNPSTFADSTVLLKTGENWRGEIKSRAKDGLFFWLDSAIIPIKNEKSDIDYYFTLALPVTERKEAEEKRNDTIQLLESIAFRTSHNVRGPLARIQGIVHLLNSGLLKPDEFKMAVSKITENTKELDGTLRALTEFVNANFNSLATATARMVE
jgi:PAS domain S-box-containing protein